jgi:hypothetical protein
MEAHTVEELRSQLSDGAPTRMKFSVKVFHVLQFTRRLPDRTEECGACWLPDGVRFVCNSHVLGCILGIRSNTINTNFRSHGFQIVSKSLINLAKCLESVSDPKHWKVRTNEQHSFTSTSLLSEVESIPCRSPTHCDVPVAPDVAKLPDVMSELVKSDTEVRLKCELAFVQSHGDVTWKESAFAAIANDWIQNIGGHQSRVELDRIVLALGRGCPDVLPNISFLIDPTANRVCKFNNYLEFALRYGITDDVVANMHQLVQPGRWFVPWFNPKIDATTATTLLAGKAIGWWLMREGARPGQFVIHQVRSRGGVTAIDIVHDPLAATGGKRWIVDVSDGDGWGGSSLRELLFERLRLNENQPSLIESEIASSRHVTMPQMFSFPGPIAKCHPGLPPFNKF